MNTLALRIILACWTTLWLGVADATPECDRAYEDAADAASLSTCLADASAGNKDAQFGYGLVLMSGKGRPSRVAEAVEWFRRSARQRNVLAQVALGRVLSDRRFGIELNEPEAYAWWVVSGEKESAVKLWSRLSPESRNRARALAAEYLKAYRADEFSLDQALVGRWRMEGTLPPSILVLSADGTWAATVRAPKQPEVLYQVSGTWWADDRYVHWLYTNSTSPYAPPGTRDRDTLVEIGRDFFVIMNKSKTRQRWVRVQ